MCGRYSITTAPEAMRRLFKFTSDTPNLRPNYNCAPTQTLPVVRLEEKGERELALMKWGLVPFWAKDAKIAYSTISARAETIAHKPAFRAAFKARRCLIPADGFYEWQPGEKKQPYRITMKDGETFAMAGLWEQWDKGEELLQTFTIIVTEGNSPMKPIHDRMPVILPPDTWDHWLTSKDLGVPQALLMSYPASKMKAYKVSTRVNSPKNNDAEIQLPITDGAIVSMIWSGISWTRRRNHPASTATNIEGSTNSNPRSIGYGAI